MPGPTKDTVKYLTKMRDAIDRVLNDYEDSMSLGEISPHIVTYRSIQDYLDKIVKLLDDLLNGITT